MTAAKIAMFLDARDRARARGDLGIMRATTADLRRLGVQDGETSATWAQRLAPKQPEIKRTPAPPAKVKRAHCEHGSIADHCPECNPELIAK